MPQVVITALRAQRKAQMREQAEAGDVWLNGDKLVFTAAFGAPASDSTVRKEFARYVAAAGLPARLRLQRSTALQRQHSRRCRSARYGGLGAAWPLVRQHQA